VGSRLVGAIAAIHSRPDPQARRNRSAAAQSFRGAGCHRIENARLYSAERERATEQQALLDTLGDLSGQLELARCLKAVLERATSLLDVTAVSSRSTRRRARNW